MKPFHEPKGLNLIANEQAIHLSGPYSYHLTFKTTEIISVEDCNGGARFAGAVVQPVPKLYVVSQGKKPIYVGVTKQSIGVRLRQGFDAKGVHGYHGYAWRHLSEPTVLDVWVREDNSGTMTDLETIEAEVVYLIRKEFGQWPEFQTEIHFHTSGLEHRNVAKSIIDYYLQ